MKPTIRELIAPYASVSIIGMCKNAGKTTVLNEIIRELSRDIGVLFEELADSSLMSAELRVAQFLCRRLTRRQYSGPADRPQLRFTQSFIASVLGISRVSVGHAISALVRRGWVETTYGGLVIVDVAALRSYAYG